MTVGGLSLKEWESKQKRLGVLGTLQGRLTNYNKKVGVYKAYYNGRLVYIGRAIEYGNGGFRKRLTDYVRNSDSGRGTKSSSMMYTNKDNISISIIIVDNQSDDAGNVDVTKQLEKALIKKYNPEWNIQLRRR